ncbi:MAG: metal-dependent transcriptional regulator [Oscillospiraceae bacterium]|nr:metal-dependent transcriptional regulator [Oscillospiraceae bacterium]
MVLQESGEMYLETILVLSQKSRFVRAIDIGEEMGFSRPSVSRAVHLLQDGQFIHIAPDGSITLTDVGREIAGKVYERHTVLTKWLTALGVDPKVAENDACKIEHVISDESFAAVKRHIGSES